MRYGKIKINIKESDFWQTVQPSLESETLQDRHQSSAGPLAWGMNRKGLLVKSTVFSLIKFIPESLLHLFSAVHLLFESVLWDAVG